MRSNQWQMHHVPVSSFIPRNLISNSWNKVFKNVLGKFTGETQKDGDVDNARLVILEIRLKAVNCADVKLLVPSISNVIVKRVNANARRISMDTNVRSVRYD